jgi:mannosidase alpha-like ER degradation enhancer 2
MNGYSILLLFANIWMKSPSILSKTVVWKPAAVEAPRRVPAVTAAQRIQLRERVRKIFAHGWESYSTHAFPMDELAPLSCAGQDNLGGIYATAIDSLDSLVLLGNVSEFRRVVVWLSENARWDRNTSVSVFETNIRAVGGLISAHILAADHRRALVPGYNNSLLELAVQLADRLMPAFDTPTGIPFGSINLLLGVAKNESHVTSTAAAGTFALEFGALSALTKNPAYKNAAIRAMEALWKHRSSIGLLGSHIQIDSGRWVVQVCHPTQKLPLHLTVGWLS